jgi:hypothetical protein
MSFGICTCLRGPSSNRCTTRLRNGKFDNTSGENPTDIRFPAYVTNQCNVGDHDAFYSTSHSYWFGFATGFQDSPAVCAFNCNFPCSRLFFK